MVQMVSEVIAVDQEQHPIKADYLDDLRAGARNGLVFEGRKWLKSQALGETQPAALTSFSTQLYSVQLYSFTVFSSVFSYAVSSSWVSVVHFSVKSVQLCSVQLYSVLV